MPDEAPKDLVAKVFARLAPRLRLRRKFPGFSLRFGTGNDTRTDRGLLRFSDRDLKRFSLTIPLAPKGSVGSAPATGGFDTVLSPPVETLHWGFSIQYSTLYLTSRFDGGPPKEEPLNQLVPLVEFRFDSPRGQRTAATANPGFAYVAVTWQVAAEAIIPLNRAGGNGPGFRAQLLLFLDDLMPSAFGKPLLSNRPDRSQTAW